MFNSLSGRFLILTAVFVMLAEILIFVPSISRFREDYLLQRLERAQIASLALLDDNMVTSELEAELLKNAEVLNVVLRRNEARQLILASPMPRPVSKNFDIRDTSAPMLIKDAMSRLVAPENEVIRVIGSPVNEAGLLIEVTMESQPLRMAMLDYGLRILVLSAVISVFTALLLFLAVRGFLVKPIKRVVGHMQRYAGAPEDARLIIEPSAGVTELREAETALRSLQTELTQSLKQKERLAQLGGAVARVSHDLRNILTTAQLFTDRIEASEDPTVKRMAPKLVSSITRAVHLCESTLAFGKAEEPGPRLAQVRMKDIVGDVVDGEQLAVGAYDLTLVDDVPDQMHVRGDAEQLFRVISNLVRNARQAIMATGEPGQIMIDGEEDETSWRLAIVDTGPGLPPKAREHLFAAFQGGVRKGGSGLGLAIAAELIRGHGGTLELTKSDHSGTRFDIVLPKGEALL
jgi:signal transduction histidine kinase